MARNWRKAGGTEALAKGLQGTDLLFGGDDTLRETVSLRLTDVMPNPDQPRRFFDQDELQQLANSFRNVGQLSPILVKAHPGEPHRYLLIAGERRWRAAELAELTHIAAHILPGEADIDQIALIENLQRINLSPVEEAEGIQRLIDRHGYNQEQAGALLGRSRTEINTTLSLLRLKPEIRQACVTSHSTLPKALLLELARMSPGEQTAAWDRARTGELTTREARAERRSTKPAPTPKVEQPKTDPLRVLGQLARMQMDLNALVADSGALTALDLNRLRAFSATLGACQEAIDSILRNID